MDLFYEIFTSILNTLSVMWFRSLRPYGLSGEEVAVIVSSFFELLRGVP